MRLVIESARLTVVHNRRLLADLRERYPAARLEAIEMGVADPLVPRPRDADEQRRSAASRRAWNSG